MTKIVIDKDLNIASGSNLTIAGLTIRYEDDKLVIAIPDVVAVDENVKETIRIVEIDRPVPCNLPHYTIYNNPRGLFDTPGFTVTTTGITK